MRFFEDWSWQCWCGHDFRKHRGDIGRMKCEKCSCKAFNQNDFLNYLTNEWHGIVISVLLGVLVFCIIILIILADANAQEFDPCFVDNDMYQRICDKIEIEKIYQQLLNRTLEWNEIHK